MNTRTKRRLYKVGPPSTPLNDRKQRDPDYVRAVVLKMGEEFIEALDKLCDVNQRSRRELVEIFVAEAIMEFNEDNNARITPL